MGLILTAAFLSPPPSFVELSPYLSLFLVGVLAAYIHNKTARRRHNFGPATKLAAELLAALSFVIICLLTPSIFGMLARHEVPIDRFHNTLTPFGLLWATFLLCYLSGTGHIARILSLRPLRYLGIISFGLYLWHPPIIRLAAEHIVVHPTLNALLAMLLSTLLATATYVAIERPFLRIRIWNRR